MNGRPDGQIDGQTVVPLIRAVIYLFIPFVWYLQRRVQHVAKENEFYMQLINLALPPETNNHSEAPERPSRGTGTIIMYNNLTMYHHYSIHECVEMPI